MKRGSLIFLLLFILSSIISASSVSALDDLQKPQFLGLNSPEKMKPNGEYIIYVLRNDKWVEAGSLAFDKHFRERSIDLGGSLDGTAVAKIRIVQKGGGAAHIDSLLLGGVQPVSIKGMDDIALKKLSQKDYDVADAYKKDIEVGFPANGKDKVLNLTARVEGERIGSIPFQFPLRNLFRKMNEDSEFYPYTINSGNHVKKPFFREYSKTGSGHPSGFTYGWVSNDDKNLLVRMDFTPDNTMDGNKDYAIVYVKTGSGLKSFRVSVPETKWGAPDFTYTDTVSYQHKVYTFRIPFSELGIKETREGEKLLLAFAAYGTAAPGDYTSDMVFDPANNRYLLIFQRAGQDDVDIYGQFINCDGTPVGDAFIILDSDIWLNSAKVTYDSINHRFLVVWGDDDIKGQILNADGTPYSGVLTIASTPESQEDPVVTYDDVNNRFFVVWIDRRNIGVSASDVYGRFVNSDGTLGASTVIICDNSGFQHSPAVAFSSFSQRYLVAWQDRRSGTNYDIYGRVSDAGGFISFGTEFVISDATYDQWSPSISYDSTNHRFLTVWHDDRNSATQISDIYGQLVNEDGSLNGVNFFISNAPNEQYGAEAAFDPLTSRFLVVWEDQRNSSLYSDIYGQYVNAGGSLNGSNFVIADAAVIDYGNPETAYNSNTHNFLVAFSTHEGNVYDFAFTRVGPPCAGETIPTLNEWGMIIFLLFAGLAAVYYLKRQRRETR